MPEIDQPRLPDNSSRTVEIGRTGTGKTVAGLWHLSNYDLDDPWVILNLKNDEHIESISKARFLPDYSYIPKKRDSGLFVLTVHPSDLKSPRPGVMSPVDNYLMRIWERMNCGVFIDEAYPLGNSDQLNAILTQGRSRRIPVIACTQRPAWVSRYLFSEASFIQVFDLNDSRDIQSVESFTPIDWDSEPALPEHNSYYYDVARDHLFKFKPVPDMDEIRSRFDLKLKRQCILV